MNFLGPSNGTVIASFVILGAIVALPIYFVVRFLRAYERRTRVRDVSVTQDEQLDAMRETIERLEQQVQRLSEAQQFTTQLLSQETPHQSRDALPPPVRRS